MSTGVKINDTDKLKVNKLCQELNTTYNFCNEKSSIQVIQKRLSKRKKIKKCSKTMYYQTELANFLKNKPIFGEENQIGSEIGPKIVSDEKVC